MAAEQMATGNLRRCGVQSFARKVNTIFSDNRAGQIAQKYLRKYHEYYGLGAQCAIALI